MKVLNVAEKNDAAKGISRALSSGQSQRREGLSKFNKIYEFDCNILDTNCKMIMTSVSGHLLDLEFGGTYRNWQGCQPLALFTAPVERFCPDKFKDIKRTLEREIRKCQALIIWTDGDREGENIGFEIIEVCKNVKQSIRVYRARFSEITQQSIYRACRNLIEPDENTSNAVEVRRELDLRIGAAFTRFQTLRLQKRFPEVLADQLISYGSCQFPTLGFVVERYKQIQDFVPEPFYKIKVTHSKDGKRVEFVWERGRLFHERVCRMFLGMCLENPTATVLSVASKPKSKWRPVALDTVELEKTVSRKLRISAKETMRIAEKLYTQGFISYPRTETNIFPNGLDLATLVQNQSQDPNWGAFAANLLDQGVNPRNGKKTDNAHPPIHPTKYTGTLQGNEKKIYEFIVRHFLACLSQDARGQETTVSISIANEKFSANGLVILQRNYLDVYPYEYWNAKTIPSYEEGAVFTPENIELVNGETSPPPLLTEADLIALMEKHGIGTDATHAEHIETIKNRNYVGEQNDRSLVPGELGMGLVEGYDSMGFEMSKPHLRSELENDLKCISDGRKQKEDVLADQIRKYREVFVKASEKVVKLDEALSTYFGEPTIANQDAPALNLEISDPIRKCPKCNRYDMVIRKTKDNGFMLSCQGYPGCKNGMFFPKFVLKACRSEVTCQRCRPGPVHQIEFEFKRGSVPPMIPLKYLGCIGGCDSDLLDLIRISEGASSRQSNQQLTNNRHPSSLSTQRNQSARSTGARPSLSTQRNQAARSTGARPSLSTQRNQAARSTDARPSLSTQRNQSARSTGARPSLSTQRNQAARSTDARPSSSTQRNQAARSTGARPIVARANETHGINSNANRPPPRRFSNGSNGSNPRPDSDGNSVICDCGKPAVLLTVRKDGPNQGRQFHKCGDDSKCKFFLWADESSETERRESGTLANNNRSNNNRQHSDGFSASRDIVHRGFTSRPVTDENSVVCDCTKPAISLTVRKEGPNQGRQFFKCGDDNKCKFFLWADEGSGNANGANENRASSGGFGAGGNSRGTNNSARSSNELKCNCNENAASRTVNKEGPNKGRQFFSCPKPMGQSCSYFQWADEDGTNQGSGHSFNNARRGGKPATRGRGRGNGAAGPAGQKRRKCGQCGEEGHTKRMCTYNR